MISLLSAILDLDMKLFIYIFLFKINDGDDDDVHYNCVDDQNVMKFHFFNFFLSL